MSALINLVLIFVLTKSFSGCTTSTQIQMQNANVDCICPKQFKEANEASNEFKFEMLKTSRTVMAGKRSLLLKSFHFSRKKAWNKTSHVSVHTRNFILFEEMIPTHYVKWFTPCNNTEATFSLCPAGFKNLEVKYDFHLDKLSVVQNGQGSSLQYLPVIGRFNDDDNSVILLYNGTEETFQISKMN